MVYLPPHWGGLPPVWVLPEVSGLKPQWGILSQCGVGLSFNLIDELRPYPMVADTEAQINSQQYLSMVDRVTGQIKRPWSQKVRTSDTGKHKGMGVPP